MVIIERYINTQRQPTKQTNSQISEDKFAETRIGFGNSWSAVSQFCASTAFGSSQKLGSGSVIRGLRSLSFSKDKFAESRIGFGNSDSD